MVKLFCAVVGVGSVFSVNIELSETVDDLKKKIKEEKPGLVYFDADLLKLYLARDGDTWLNSRGEDMKALKKGEIPDRIKSLIQEELLLDEAATLDDEEYFRANFKPRNRDIHVLVELPTQVAAPSDVIPSLPPTTIHRHPERLKRWAAINAMIRQKNQDANQDANEKTTTEGAKNKKRKNHDIDKSVGYSTLCWEDIKRIYDFDDSYELPLSDIPDADIELLLTRIRDLRELYGQISDGKEAKRLFFIAPILETVSRLLGDVRILVEEDVVGRNVLLKGRFEFVLKRGTKRISIVEAKREDMQQGVVQNVTGLEALADVEDLTVAYGIVTNFLEWKFLISGDEKVREHETVLPQTNTIPTFEGLKEIVGKIYRMLSNE